MATFVSSFGYEGERKERKDLHQEKNRYLQIGSSSCSFFTHKVWDSSGSLFQMCSTAHAQGRTSRNMYNYFLTLYKIDKTCQVPKSNMLSQICPVTSKHCYTSYTYSYNNLTHPVLAKGSRKTNANLPRPPACPSHLFLATSCCPWVC